MVNLSADFPLTVPEAHLRALGRGMPEEGVYVFWGTHFGQPRLSWSQGPIWRTHADVSDKTFQRLVWRSYKVALSVGRLLLLVSFWPDPEWHYLMAQQVHERLWPIEGSRLYYPVPFFPNKNATEAASMFNWSLGILDSPHVRGPLEPRGAQGESPPGT
jgi:hypothetical protein